MIAFEGAARITQVASSLAAYGRLAVATSGGIDSLALATIAGRHHAAVEMFHAVSPAVPAEATERVRAFAARERWTLHVVDAGEFARESYLSNPVNRCYFCKQSLYTTISTIAGATSAQIVSGANADDLGEYRPGLDAAREFGVVHPFAALGIDKRTIREMARALGLGELSALPSSPCLSSRIETGIRIDAGSLARVHVVETRVRALLPEAASIRCRVRATGIEVEIDATTLASLSDSRRDAVERTVRAIVGNDGAVSFAPYRVGSAFLLDGRAASHA